MFHIIHTLGTNIFGVDGLFTELSFFFKSWGAGSKRLSISFFVLISETPNSGGAKEPPVPLLTTALVYEVNAHVLEGGNNGESVATPRD